MLTELLAVAGLTVLIMISPGPDLALVARNMVVEVEHPEGGSVKMPGNPVKFSDTNEESFSPPPLLGAHTAEVLQTLGKRDDEIASLQEKGII